MNDLLEDIEILRIVRYAVDTSQDRDTIVNMLDKAILQKQNEIIAFELGMEEEIARGKCSQR